MLLNHLKDNCQNADGSLNMTSEEMQKLAEAFGKNNLTNVKGGGIGDCGNGVNDNVLLELKV